MLAGFLALRAAAGMGRKTRRHCGDNCDFFWIMQAVMRLTSGMKLPQSRMASGVQACSCSWL